MLVQAVLGLLFPAQYRDADWIRAAWWGSDWVTLVAAPVLLASVTRGYRKSVVALLISPGILAYESYNSAFYLFGAALNIFFPLYILTFAASVLALLTTLATFNSTAVAATCLLPPARPIVGAYFAVLGVGLMTAWMSIWARYVFGGYPTPVEPDAFKVIAALDLSFLSPALTTAGVFVLRRSPWGHAAAAIVGVQSGLYLLALAAGSLVAIDRGLVDAPGEVPIWGILFLVTTAVTLSVFLEIKARVDVIGHDFERRLV
jgi:hypothetical protein